MSHYGIPWPVVRATYRFLRKYFFTIHPREQKHLLVDEDVEEIRRALGQNHFTNSWELSYNYYSEDLNMRRPDYNESDPDRPWYQTHIRGFEQEDGTVKLMAHFEYEPTEYPEAHLHNKNLSVEAGIRELKKILNDKQIQYKEIFP